MRAEGFFCNLDILYGGLGIGKLQFLIKKNFIFFFAVIFFQFLVIKALDLDWIRIRIGLQPQTLDPDRDQMNADPKPWINFMNNTCNAVPSIRHHYTAGSYGNGTNLRVKN